MRFLVERRPISVNLRCVRVPAPGGGTWLLASIPALGAASAEPSPPADGHDAAPPEELPAAGRGGLAAAEFTLPVDARRRGPFWRGRIPCSPRRSAPTRRTAASRVEALLRRAELDGGDELVRALAGRQTFSGIVVGWPLPGLDRRRLVTLSAAPLFGRQREFLGYRGFGVLGEEIDAAFEPAGLRRGRRQPLEVAAVEPAARRGRRRASSRGRSSRQRRGPAGNGFRASRGGGSRSPVLTRTPPSTRTEASRLTSRPRRARPRARPRRPSARRRFTSCASSRFPPRQTSYQFAPARSTG